MAVTLADIKDALRTTAVANTAGSIVLDDSRAVLSYEVFSDTDEWLLNLQTDGPYLLIKPMDTAEQDPKTYHTTYHIKVYVWFGFDRNSPTDFGNFETWIEGLRYSWSNFAIMRAQGVGTCANWEVTKEETDPDINPAAVLYTIRVSMQGAD